MNLDEAQKTKVREWIAEGLSLSDIQKKLAAELGIRLTYMEARFLLDDLKLQPQDRPRSAHASQNLAGGATPEAAPNASAAPGVGAKPSAAGMPGRGVSVAVDQVTRAGALVSGRVTFSDGMSAEWHLDQMGRLGLAAKQPGYRPPQEDVIEFQTQLQNELAKLGY